MGYIYKITNTISGKCYIGETAKEDPEIRWNQHKGTIRRGAGCPALRDAVNKYGIENFKFEVLVICFDECRFEMERLYIKKYNSQVPNGYNISAGGMGGNFTGRKHTPETIARIIETTRLYRQNNPDWFEKYREKHKQVMSKVDISAAMKKSEKWQKFLERFPPKVKKEKIKKANIAISLQENIPTLNIIRQNKDISKHERHHSEETKSKIRESVLNYYAASGNVNVVNTKKHQEAMAKAVGIKVNKYDDNNNLIDSYDSIKGGARENNIPHSTLSLALKHNRKAGGFVWRKIPKEGST